MGNRGLLNDERDELIALLRDLSDNEWETESLCAGWRVRDVVAHLLYDELRPFQYFRLGAGQGFDADRINGAVVERSGHLSPAELLEHFENSGQRISRLWPTLGLADILVHQQDIRRPLGRPRTIPAERLEVVLKHPDPFARPWRYTKGLRFEATDLNWAKGKGPLVSGPGEAIVLAMVGRSVAFDELTGEGVDVLRARIGTQ